MENIKCEICLSSCHHDRVGIDVFSREAFNISRCPECTHLFINNPPSPQKLKYYYSNEVGDGMHLKRDPLSSKLQSYLMWLDIKDLLKRITKSDLVIDWGCGFGNLTQVLARKGYNVESVDVFPREEWSHKHIPYHQFYHPESSKESISNFLKEKKPIAVVMRHSLEHVLCPTELITLFMESNVKYLLIIVPNSNSLLRKVFKNSWSLWDPPRHIHYFNLKSLSYMMNTRKYDLVKADHYGIDEVINSCIRFFYLYLDCKFTRKLFKFNNFLTSISSALFYPITNTVIRAFYEKR